PAPKDLFLNKTNTLHTNQKSTKPTQIVSTFQSHNPSHKNMPITTRTTQKKKKKRKRKSKKEKEKKKNQKPITRQSFFIQKKNVVKKFLTTHQIKLRKGQISNPQQ
ncbi:hypothetical protein TorRG33x02_190520, partial [Trema orientale]